MDDKRRSEIIGMALSFFLANLDDAKDAMDEPDVDFPSEAEVQSLLKPLRG